MKNIKIDVFLASSLNDFSNERNELDGFVNDLMGFAIDRYEGSDINIDIGTVRCENEPDYMRKGRTQDDYNRLIEQSEICVFLFLNKAGIYTIEEFDIAVNAQQKEPLMIPAITMFFMNNDSDIKDESVIAFKKRLDKDGRYKYTECNHIDTVKLRLLMTIALMYNEYLDLKYENGNIYFCDSIVSIPNAEQFKNNEKLQMIEEKIRNAEDEAETTALMAEKECCKKEIFNSLLDSCKCEISGKTR